MVAERFAEEKDDEGNPVKNTEDDDREGLSDQDTNSVLHAIHKNLQLSDEPPTVSGEEDEDFK